MLFMRKDDLFYESSGHYVLFALPEVAVAVADDDDE